MTTNSIDVLNYNLQNGTNVFSLSISQNDAEEILQRYNYGKNRRIRQSSIDRYANEMTRGSWDEDACGPLIFAKSVDGQINLMDGQHRLHAIVKSGKKINFLIKIARDKYDLSDFYSKIDTGDIRNIRDTPTFMDRSESWGVGVQLLGAANTAIKNIYLGFVPTKEKFSNHAQSVFIDQWKQQIIEFSDLYKDSTIHRTTLSQASVMGFCLIILKYNRDRAIDFISKSFTGSMMSVNDPRMRLYTFLKEVGVRDMARRTEKPRCIHLLYVLHMNVAWSKFLSKEEYKRPLWVYGIETKQLIIEGTPYNTTFVGNGINAIEVRRLISDLR